MLVLVFGLQPQAYSLELLSLPLSDYVPLALVSTPLWALGSIALSLLSVGTDETSSHSY